MSKYFVYAADHALDIANSIFDVDEAMKTGYGFKWGPFELMDEVGPQWIADKLREEGRTVPALLDAVGDGTFYKDRRRRALLYARRRLLHPGCSPRRRAAAVRHQAAV